jgi:hypothetical protein
LGLCGCCDTFFVSMSCASYDPGSSDTERFLWITRAAKGYSVEGEVVSGETGTGDNTKTIAVLTLPTQAPIFDVTRGNRRKRAQLTTAESYTFVTLWPELPQPWYFRYPEGVAVDTSGNVYFQRIK